QAARDAAIPAGDVEDATSGDITEQPLRRGADELQVELVACIPHLLVPERGVLVPGSHVVHVAMLCDSRGAPRRGTRVRRRVAPRLLNPRRAAAVFTLQ